MADWIGKCDKYIAFAISLNGSAVELGALGAVFVGIGMIVSGIAVTWIGLVLFVQK